MNRSKSSREVCSTDEKTTTTPNEKLNEESLISLYQEQWVQIRHLDSLDFRNMTLLPIVVSVLTVGTGYLSKSNPQVPSYVLTFALVVIGLSFSGCYTTFRNWLCYMRRFSILTSLEKQMHMVENGIILKSIQFKPPNNYWEFSWSLVKSIRFPLTVFYAVLGGCGVLIFNKNTDPYFTLLSIIIIFIIFSYCNVITWLSLKKEFITTKRSKECECITKM